MVSPKDIRIETYDYPLPEGKIALYPLPERDASKLLVYRHGQISEHIFRDIADELPANALLVFNDTKVIHARIVTHTPTGARIEIFCLEPIEPVDVQLAFQQKKRCAWKCFVGGNRKWKDGELQIKSEKLKIKRGVQIDDAWEIIFEWDNDLTFAEILDSVGKIPLPPYIHREVEDSDEERYQTIFAKIKGSVAAPTASLHFSEQVLESLETKGIETATLTLHVGAGTFKPVTTETIGSHIMHDEKVIVSQDCLHKIRKAIAEKRPIIPVGTTSLRSLESLYWLKPNAEHVEQWAPYSTENGEWRMENYASPLCYGREQHFPFSIFHSPLEFSTSLIIAPPYKFRIATGIVTNFHQPKSTLLLLISALVGNEWHKIYDYALSHDFRFLSYGDSCLLLPN
ncbi:MAG: S-adenosylmethionine:tRNA ribosyltransferase-isomerase [Bacteroidales bacterium]|jgi:S-adenosylmethionine:tRNA ribosyltransferase-isomerase|nr:S-adenosylmethionine:tRNA ribosyltransferase-isomerase [Bacteroidales bacterium]